MTASRFSFMLAMLILLAGMGWGLQMAITNNHGAMPAHAHLNLLGFVALFLFGIYYRLHPAIDRTRLALAQAGIWAAGTIVLSIGVALVHTGHPEGDPLAGIGSMIVFADALLFTWLLFRTGSAVRVEL